MIINGDALTVLKRMDDESVHMAVTSSPYYGLRAYNTEPQIWDGDPNCDHEWGTVHSPGYRSSDTKPGSLQNEGNKNRQNLKSDICSKCGAWKGELGQEPTPEDFARHITTICHEIKRVLRNDGVFWFNIGTSFANKQIESEENGNSPKRKRGDILEGTITEDIVLNQSLPQVENESPPTYLQNYADRMRRVETRPFQSPPRPFRARETEERPPTPPISPPPIPPPSNVYMWNGSRTFIPEWAKVPKSAWQVGRDPLLQVPIEQAPRLQMAHALRRVPMDGVNRHEDIIIRESYFEGEKTILMQATTKVRGITPSQTDFRSLHVPLKVIPCLLQMVETVEKEVLPPAEQDFNLDNSSLFITNEIIGRYNYIVEIKAITEMQGDERLVRIYREDRDGQDQGGIAFPWMFTTLFNAKISNVFKEINGNPNNSTTST